MRKTVHKVIWGWDFDKEEAWLNDMAAKGLSLISVGLFRYDFEETDPGEYQIALELLEHTPNHPETEQYFRFLEETGVEQIGTVFRWAYYRRKTADGPFEVFSDKESRMKHLIRILWLVAIAAGGNFYAGVYNLWLFHLWHNPISLLGIISLVLCALCCWGIWKLWKKIKQLKDESQIYE